MADQALPMMIQIYSASWFGWTMFAAFFAGLMSSVDSLLNSTATFIYQRYLTNRLLKKGGR